MANWDVFREIDNLRREIDDAFRGLGMGRPFATPFFTAAPTRRFPRINLSEDEGTIYVQAPVPGVDPKGIDLSVLRNTLTISGERKPLDEKEGQMVHRNEIGTGKFSRTIELPAEVDPSRVTASCRNGILQVSLPKAEHAKARRIEIKAQ